jgi:hypothetical protein
MEKQELKEFQLRENEIDLKREEKLVAIERALRDRDESNEFLASQRVEAVRQIRMEEREKTLQKIRNKRIKVLRRLAHRRNQLDPKLSSSGPKDIVSEYFDHGSEKYVPIKRSGKNLAIDQNNFDVNTRISPLSSIQNILRLESTLPSAILSHSADMSDNKVGGNLGGPTKVMSKTGPLGGKVGVGAAEHRLTSGIFFMHSYL